MVKSYTLMSAACFNAIFYDVNFNGLPYSSCGSSRGQKHWHLPFFSFIRQENWSAGFSQPGSNSLSLKHLWVCQQATSNETFSIPCPFLSSLKTYSRAGLLWMQSWTHFLSSVENRMSFMSAHLTWKALMILFPRRVAVAKWLLCVWLSHLSILINPQDCVF